MKSKRALLLSVSAVIVFFNGAAFAGPTVMVTFKNQNNLPATYSAVAGALTYADASPKPLAVVKAGSSDVFRVKNEIGPDANFASMTYRSGSKECRFRTALIISNRGGLLVPGGRKTPNWTKSATGSGGAVCTATITSTNLATFEWAVEFAMR